MFGWVATACGRLASAPGNVLVSDRATWRLAGWVMECVSRGGVRRVQVQPQRRAAVSRHMCVFCNRLLQQTLAELQVRCYASQRLHQARCGVHSRVQAAAAARVAGGPDILDSAANGDGVSVLCHCIADAGSVNKRRSDKSGL